MTKTRDRSVASQTPDAETAPTREIELKVELDVEALRRIRANPALKRLGVAPAATRTLRSIYFDTPDQALKARRIALRARKVENAWIQTVKCGGPLRSGLSTPTEDEAPVAGPEPELEAISDAALKKTISRLAKKKGLAPAFETRLKRTTRRLVSADGDEVELAIDSGEALADNRSAPIFEVELELKKGRPSALFELAETVFGSEPLRFSALSKAERGYRLAAGEAPPPIAAMKASAVRLDSVATVEEALGEILRGCAEMVANNLYAAQAIDAPEATHQLRVGLRRLRTALKLFRKVVTPEAAAAIESQARTLFRVAGPLRDVDVLIDETLVEKPGEPSIEGMAMARAAFVERREAIRDETRKALSEGGATAFALRLGAFVALEGWRSAGEKRGRKLAKPARPLADAAIERFWRKAAKRGDVIETLTIAERHEMRKALKDLRYAIEFFRSIYPKTEVDPFISRLKKLQDLFGALNDMAMAETLLTLAAPDDKLVRSVGEALLARSGMAAEKTWRKAKARWKSLNDEPRFWT